MFRKIEKERIEALESTYATKAALDATIDELNALKEAAATKAELQAAVKDAQDKVYANIDKVAFENSFYRHDIGGKR